MQSLSDKIRDMRRTTLQNLLFIILDEISLVKSDMLYQVHFRLSREIKQINLAEEEEELHHPQEDQAQAQEGQARRPQVLQGKSMSWIDLLE